MLVYSICIWLALWSAGRLDLPDGPRGGDKSRSLHLGYRFTKGAHHMRNIVIAVCRGQKERKALLNIDAFFAHEVVKEAREFIFSGEAEVADRAKVFDFDRELKIVQD